jgi:hypothetical protein
MSTVGAGYSVLSTTAEHMDGDHWLDFQVPPPFRSKQIESSDLALSDVCERYEAIDLWIDPDPNAQLLLVGLLDYLRPYEKIGSKLTLIQADVRIGEHIPEELAKWRLPEVKISQVHLEIASAAWRAYCAPTPQDFFSLVSKDLSVLPQLRQALQELLEELPMPATGLGAMEMRMLELISHGKAKPLTFFPAMKS